jgi:hypothetical protein
MLANYFESGAGDGNRTNTIGKYKALLPAFQFNWSQMESRKAGFRRNPSAPERSQAEKKLAVPSTRLGQLRQQA